MADLTAPSVDAADGHGPPTWLSLLASGRRLGHYVWLEEWLFETLGDWAAEDTAPTTQVVLATASRHHGWRADEWRRLLPALADLEPASLVVAPSARIAAALTDLRDAARADGSSSGHALAHRVVVPRLVTAYEQHLRQCRPAADGPVQRLLELVLFDTRRELSAAEVLAGDSAVVATVAAAVDTALPDGEDLAGPLG